MVLSTHTEEKHTEQKKKRFLPWRAGLRWKPFASALIAVGLLVFYLTRVAPSLIPVPPGIRVPCPQATAVLEDVCAWCGDHQGYVVLMAAGLLAAGFLRPLSAARYFVYVAIFSSLALTFTYFSISAPIDRLLKAVQDNLPKDKRVPSYPEKR